MGGCVSSASTSPRPSPERPIPLVAINPTDRNPQTDAAEDTTPTEVPSGSTSSTIVSTIPRSNSSLRVKLPRPSLMSRNSLNALRTYATLADPASSLPASVLLFANAQTTVIFDAYPKAKYHFLVLPRYPFPPQSDPDSNRSTVKLDHLDDLKSLLLKPNPDVRDEVIRAMIESAREVEEMIRDEMVKTEGFEWKIDVGFHAVPSMKHVHLHVISEDRISPSLKTKKHHNSFRPDLGFFLDAMEVQRWLESDPEVLRERVSALSGLEPLLESTLTCFKCDEPFSNIPKLKAHLEKEFAKEKTKALNRIRRTGHQRSSDEDDIF